MQVQKGVLALVAALLAAPGLAGCVGLGLGPSHNVERTQLATGAAWNRNGLFSVRVLDPTVVQVRIEALARDGRTLQAAGPSDAALPPVNLTLPDGTWTLTYFLDGKSWETIGPAQVDSTPPRMVGLETLGAAQQGAYLLGAGASVDGDAAVKVVRQADGVVVGTGLPLQLTGLGDGVHAYDVVATDPAGNQAVVTVQVRAGTATQLPPGRYALGITARYTSSARLWDLTALDAYLSPAAARAAVQWQWLGNGTGLTPSDPAVQAVVRQAVDPSASTGRTALALFKWMVDNTDYDTARLTADDLLSPAQTIQAHGGVCRDLAALYASLLRAAGVPARLVTGYLGGRVSGFHAWVEFYGGDGHGPSPWVPVDVSAVDGLYSPEVALQAFGAREPAMLALHAVTPEQERSDWTHAAAVSYRYPPDRPEPAVSVESNLTAEFREEAVLCIDPTHLGRAVAPDSGACGPGYPLYSPHFLSRAAFVLDYGVAVGSAPAGTSITATLSYPDDAAVAPDTVASVTYGAVFTMDAATATESATLER